MVAVVGVHMCGGISAGAERRVAYHACIGAWVRPCAGRGLDSVVLVLGRCMVCVGCVPGSGCDVLLVLLWCCALGAAAPAALPASPPPRSVLVMQGYHACMMQGQSLIRKQHGCRVVSLLLCRLRKTYLKAAQAYGILLLYHIWLPNPCIRIWLQLGTLRRLHRSWRPVPADTQ